jgi:polyphosphate kinase 2
MFTEDELKLLNSYKAVEYLLRADQLDFEDTVKQLKYEKELNPLQVKLIKVQNWVVENNEQVLILVEGREFAGKRTLIRAFTEHLNPRSMRMVALSKPTPTERTQWYFKRYIEQIPERGEIVFFDRSWYNRAMVEPVNGFCTKEEYERFMREVNHFERMLSEDGIKIIKIYLSITKEEQKRRIEDVRQNPLRRWELTPVDLRAVELWDHYTKYKEEMFRVTDTERIPWHIIREDDKRDAALQAFKRVLEILPY